MTSIPLRQPDASDLHYLADSNNKRQAVLRGGWILLASPAAFILGWYLYSCIANNPAAYLDHLPSWLLNWLANLAFIPFALLMFVPARIEPLTKAPLLISLASSGIGSLLALLSQTFNDGLISSLVLALPPIGSAFWLVTMLTRPMRARPARITESFQRHHFDIVALDQPRPPVAPTLAQPSKPPVAQTVAKQSPATSDPTPPTPPAPLPIQPQVPSQPKAEQESAQALPAGFSFEWTQPRGGFDSLAGMVELKQQLRQAIAGMRSYSCAGPVADLNGILLSGPPGNGKTAFAQAIAAELQLPLLRVGVQDLMSKWINESPTIIRELFRLAGRQPSVVFFDEFDAVAISRGSDSNHGEDKKAVNALLAEIDKARNKHIVVLAATNFPERLDAGIVRPGRFDFSIEVPYPDEAARLAILSGLLQKYKLQASTSTLTQVARLWERRSVAFIESVTKRLREQDKNQANWLTLHDFKSAARAASRRSSAIPCTGVPLDELAMPAAVRHHVDQLAWRLRHWEDIEQMGGSTPSGILLYGPPGTGKTSLVRALARELNWHVFELDAVEVLHKPGKLNETLELASQHRPAFIFLDEAEELLRDRRHSSHPAITNQILKSLDGFLGRVPEVVFVAATNHIEQIDAAALRGGRFDDQIEMPYLWGSNLTAYWGQLLAKRRQISFAGEVTPESLTNEFIELAPADAQAILSQAVNASFIRAAQLGRAPCVTMAHIHQASRSLGLVMPEDAGATDWVEEGSC